MMVAYTTTITTKDGSPFMVSTLLIIETGQNNYNILEIVVHVYLLEIIFILSIISVL